MPSPVRTSTGSITSGYGPEPPRACLRNTRNSSIAGGAAGVSSSATGSGRAADVPGHRAGHFGLVIAAKVFLEDNVNLIRRIYNDYWMSGRWEEYRDFLSVAKDHGYQLVRHQDAEGALATAGERPLFFLRHDIDSDVAIARTMFSIEKELGVRSTYYFRRCTADQGLMREILSFGSEVGYHYEELSGQIKAMGIRSREEVLPQLNATRELFLRNLKEFEFILGDKVHTVASHGDWANRAIGVENTVLMNEDLRVAGGIRLEAYDELLAGRLSFRAADRMHSDLWQPSSPIEAIKALKPVILVLVHPRQWQRAPLNRLQIDIRRLLEGLHHRWKRTHLKYGLKDLVRIIREIRSYERRTIKMYGPPMAYADFKLFTKRHPTYKIIPNKTIGVALIELPGQFETYLKGSRMNNLRHARTRALKLGYVVKRFKSLDHRDDVILINRSAEQRCGRLMSNDYVDDVAVNGYLTQYPDILGVFDKENHLRAYLNPLLRGEVCVLSRIIGHKQFLNDGIMYLLLSELVKILISDHPQIKFLMYDTFIGATKGLRFFKEQCGFVPFRVKWQWQNKIDLI